MSEVELPPASGAPGELIVSGGGSTLVATDILLAQEALLRSLQAEAEGWRQQLIRVLVLCHAPAPTWGDKDTEPTVISAVSAVNRVTAASRELAEALRAAAEGYGEAERNAEAASRQLGAGVGFAVGRLLPMLMLAANPMLTVGIVSALLGVLSGEHRKMAPLSPPANPRARRFGAPWVREAAQHANRRTHPEPPRAPGTSEAAANGPLEWLSGHRDLLSDPVFVAFVRAAVASIDDVAAGAAGVPFPLAMALGDDGLGILGVGTSAAGALALARPFGYLRETPVRASPVPVAGRFATPRPAEETAAAVPPVGLADLAERIPSVSHEGAQVRIERYGTEEKPAWVVYIGGTAEWNPRSTEQPWDLTSNITAVAGESAGSYRAVREAMLQAGIRPEDPVVEVGHSQGGLIAAQIAASGEFRSVGVATFGAPTGRVSVPGGVPTIALEHTDDLVPALGGQSAVATGRLLVRREVFASGPPPITETLPAHSLSRYTETARLGDASPEPRLQEFRAHLAEVVGQEPGRSTLWTARRTGVSRG